MQRARSVSRPARGFLASLFTLLVLAGTAVGDERGGDGAGDASRLLFFWGVGCPHCENAKPFVAGLAEEYPGLVIEAIEVRQDAEGRERFIRTMRELGAEAAGISTFVAGDGYVVGFAPGVTEKAVRDLVARALRGDPVADEVRLVDLPLLGAIDPAAHPLPAFTLLIGLLDGINPCAMWVLPVLLSILVHVKSRARLLLFFGATFVVASGVVYFVFRERGEGPQGRERGAADRLRAAAGPRAGCAAVRWQETCREGLAVRSYAVPSSSIIVGDEADAELAALAKAIAHPVRVQIIRMLVRKAACICGDIVDELPLAQSTVSQHLKVLKEAGLIRGEVDGPRICYCVEPRALRRLKVLVAGM